jgi:predicted kinase
MAKVIMGIGIPGSGKTTVLKPFSEENNYTYISPDEIRFELTGSMADQSKNREVWAEAHKRVKDALSRGETVVFDATFAHDSERKTFIQFARDHGAEKVQGVHAEVPYDIASERNSLRERVVPTHAMERMHSTLNEKPPSLDDGFDSVFHINELQELERAEVESDEKVITESLSGS